MKYERTKLRELIKALTAQELDESLDDFPDVRNQFTDGQEKYLRDKTILDYFEKHQEEFPKLLEAIKKCNLTAYNDYEKSFKDTISESGDVSKISFQKNGQQETKAFEDLKLCLNSIDWHHLEKFYHLCRSDKALQKVNNLDEIVSELNRVAKPHTYRILIKFVDKIKQEFPSLANNLDPWLSQYGHLFEYEDFLLNCPVY